MIVNDVTELLNTRGAITDQVTEFHKAFGAYSGQIPSADVPDEVVRLRMELIAEEAREAILAMGEKDIHEIAKELADLVYVTFGTAIAYGIDLEDVVTEVHRSNMTKIPVDGQPLYREDGKVLKPDTYKAPDLETVLHRQLQIKVAEMVIRQMAESEQKAREIREGMGVQ